MRELYRFQVLSRGCFVRMSGGWHRGLSVSLGGEMIVETVPAIHVVLVVHLCFVAAFMGLFLCEAVAEGYGSKNELHPIGIRMHYLMDIFVEIPLMTGILVTGIILAFLVDKLSTLHIILIACGSLSVMACFFSFFRFVRTRNRVISNDPIDHDTLVKIRTKFGIFTFAVCIPLLLAALIIGFWLARQRAIALFAG